VSWQTALLSYSGIAWVVIIALAVAEISAARRDELAAATAVALLWPVSLVMLLALTILAPRHRPA